MRISKTENLWRCPVCGHVMTEEQSKGYRGCPTGMHFAQHEACEEIDCPDCYGGHLRPCQVCGDTGRVINIPKASNVRGERRRQPELNYANQKH